MSYVPHNLIYNSDCFKKIIGFKAFRLEFLWLNLLIQWLSSEGGHDDKKHQTRQERKRVK